MNRTLSVCAVLALGLVGCGESGVDLDDAETVLALVSVDGEALPFTIDRPVGAAFVVQADTIWLFEDGTWHRSSTREYREADGVVRDISYEDEGWITLDDGDYVLEFECNDTPLSSFICVAPDRLRRLGTISWEIVMEYEVGAPVMRFEDITR